MWRGPWWLDAAYLEGEGPKPGQAALATGFRTAVVQLLAVLGAGIALLFTASNYRLSRRGQVTDRFVKALERLGSDEMYVRIGGVIALEQIVQDAPDQATHAAQVLNAFVRDRAPRRATKLSPPSIPPHLPNEPAADVQQVLTALTRPEARRHATQDHFLDFVGLHLAGVGLYDANLTNAQLIGADLTNARLNDANLTNAGLYDANLTGARLGKADLRQARGLTVEQVLSAIPIPGTKLPPKIAEDPRLLERIREVEAEQSRQLPVPGPRLVDQTRTSPPLTRRPGPDHGR